MSESGFIDWLWIKRENVEAEPTGLRVFVPHHGISVGGFFAYEMDHGWELIFRGRGGRAGQIEKSPKGNPNMHTCSRHISSTHHRETTSSP